MKKVLLFLLVAGLLLAVFWKELFLSFVVIAITIIILFAGQRIVKGTADFVTGDAFDFDKKGGLFEGKKKEVNVAKNISSLEEPSPNIITSNQQVGGGDDGGGASASPPPRSEGNILPFIMSKNVDNPTVLASKFYGVSLV
mgnify:CR=1 FL=1